MAEPRIRVVYADDEPIARRGLHRLLAAERDVDIVGECENGVSAVETIRKAQPDVILLDVAMPGLSGVEVMRMLDPDERPAAVFITAFDTFAIDAFELHAVDYLLKPFDEGRFRTAFARVRERLAARRPGLTDAVLDTLSRGFPADDRLAVKHGDSVVLIPPAEILWCEAEDNYVRIHTPGRRYLVRMTMRTLTEKLGAERFARIHRSFLVNLSQVRELRPAPAGDYRVILKDGTTLAMARSYRDEILRKVSDSRPRR